MLNPHPYNSSIVATASPPSLTRQIVRGYRTGLLLAIALFFLAAMLLAGEAHAEGGQRVNVNTATLEELQELSGVGPARAQTILDARDEGWECSGDPTIADEAAGDYALQDIHGIGDATAEKMVADGATCEGETVLATTSASGPRKFGAPKDDDEGGI